MKASSNGLRLVAEFDRRQGWVGVGLKSCAHWLAWSCSVSPQAAREYLRVARTLEELPLISGAFAAGRLSFSKVKAVTRAAGVVAEQTLLEQALVHTAAQLERVVRGFRKTDSAGRAEQDKRTVRFFFDEDGMLVFAARLPPDEGGILLAAIRQAEHSLYAPDRPPADSDSSAADGLIAMAQNSLAAGPVDSSGDDRHLVVVHVDARVLAETVDSPMDPEGRCHLQDGPGVARTTAERLLCDAAVVAAVRTSLGPTMAGEPLRLGRKTRKISPGLRRALRVRDDGCQHPGCHRRRHLEAHHVQHWKDGGPTNLDNLVLVCRFHHMQVHEGGFTVSPAPAGWVFRRPDRAVLTAVPAPLPGPVLDTVGEQWDPGLIHPGWRGERFSLADSVAVLCRATQNHNTGSHITENHTLDDRPVLDRTTTNYGDPEFDNIIRINDFSRHMT